MAKQIENLAMFVNGEPGGAPSHVMFTYDIVDGAASLRGGVETLPEPVDHSDTVEEIWALGVAAINTKHGIS